MKTYYVYIMASKRNGTLYIGVTSDLVRRVHQHKTNAHPGFTERYRVHNLVYYESTNEVLGALQREKQLKTWKRAWKIALIEQFNPTWRDLCDDIVS